LPASPKSPLASALPVSVSLNWAPARLSMSMKRSRPWPVFCVPALADPDGLSYGRLAADLREKL